MKYSHYVISIPKGEHTFLFNTKNNLSLKVENRLLEKAKTDCTIKNQLTNFLSQNRFLQEYNELENLIKVFKKRDRRTLRIIILAHGDCNFRCKYCYEKFSNCSISSNKIKIINFVKDKLLEDNFEDLHISWFGGEPLLGYKEILELSKDLYSQAKKLGIHYHSDMTTNGFLLTKTVLTRLITECHIKTYQITIDGSKEGHDNQRVLKNGHGTYERILNNLLKSKTIELDFNIFLRINVSQDNYYKVNDFLLNDAQYFKDDKRFRLIFRNVGDWGCGDRREGYEVKRFDNDVSFELSKKAIQLGFDLFDSYSITSNYFSCYAQKKNTYTIDTQGNLLKCTVALYNEKNRIGRLGSPEINEKNHRLWVNAYDFKEKCLKCKLLAICKGGACPKKEIFNEQTFEEKCTKLQNAILHSFELAILSNNISYELKASD